MGKTDPTAARHKQQSMIIVPFRSTGIKGEQPQGQSCVSSWGRRTPQPPGTSSSPWSSFPSGPPESKVSNHKNVIVRAQRGIVSSKKYLLKISRHRPLKLMRYSLCTARPARFDLKKSKVNLVLNLSLCF
jgi:hypothetical protein